VTLRLAKSALTSADLLARLAGQDAVVKTLTAIAASTQDAIKLAGRAGGTSSYVATLTPGTLTASRTVTVPDLTGTMAVSGASQTVTFGVGIIGTDPGGSELLRVGGDVRCAALTASGDATIGASSGNTYTVRARGNGGTNIVAIGGGALAKIQGYDSTLTTTLDLTLQPSGGAVTIGTDPGGSEKLRVGGSMRCQRASINGGYVFTDGDLGVARTATTGAVYFGTANTRYLYFDGTNYNLAGGGMIVGTDPGGSSLLRVGGEIQASTRLLAGTTTAHPSAPTSGAISLGPTTGRKIDLFRDSNAHMGLGVNIGGGTYEMNLYGAAGPASQGTMRFGFVSDANPGVWTERMRLDAAGNLGIGTTPTAKLHVLTSTNDGLRISDGTVTGVVYSSSGPTMVVGTTSNHSLTLFTNNTSRAVIGAGGNLILGTDPGGSGLLRVGGDVRASGSLTLDNFVFSGKAGSGTGGNYRVVDDGGTTRWLAGLLGTAGARAFTIYDIVNAATRLAIHETTGAVIIGTDPNPGGSELLRVGGDVRCAVLTARGSTSSVYLDRTVASSASVIYLRDTTSTKYNWLFGAQYNVNDGWEITPSTAVGGSTYSTSCIRGNYDGSSVKIGFLGAAPVARPNMAAATGTATRTTFDTTTVTVAQLAERVKALIDDLRAYGLEG
jgi:hypothetical protein